MRRVLRSSQAPRDGGFERVYRKWPELLALVAFVSICVVLVPRHEPWADEAQSWMLAKSCGFSELIFHKLGYEGTPGLWVTVLYPFAHLGAPYIVLNWMGAAFAAAGVALLLWRSPFPRFIRLLLPFTFFLQYQYAIISRSYCMLMLLGGACAYFFRKGRSHLVPFTLCAVVLAQLSLHALILACCMALAFAVRQDLFEQLRYGRGQRAAILSCAGFFAASIAFAIYVAHDAHALYEPEVPLGLYWRFPISDGLPLIADTMRTALEFALTGSCISGFVFLVLLTLWLAQREALLEALPLAAIALFFGIFYFHGHHSGILTVTLFVVLWMVWPRERQPLYSLHTLFLVAFTGMLLVQIGWTRFCIVSDYKLPYSGAADAARLIHQIPNDAKVFSYGFFTVGLQPYFDHQRFANLPQEQRYWNLRDDNTVDGDIKRLASEKPEWVIDTGVAEEKYFGRLKPILRRDYHLVRMDCGTQFFQDSFYVASCYGMYHRKDAQQSVKMR